MWEISKWRDGGKSFCVLYFLVSVTAASHLYSFGHVLTTHTYSYWNPSYHPRPGSNASLRVWGLWINALRKKDKENDEIRSQELIAIFRPFKGAFICNYEVTKVSLGNQHDIKYNSQIKKWKKLKKRKVAHLNNTYENRRHGDYINETHVKFFFVKNDQGF